MENRKMIEDTGMDISNKKGCLAGYGQVAYHKWFDNCQHWYTDQTFWEVLRGFMVLCSTAALLASVLISMVEENIKYVFNIYVFTLIIFTIFSFVLYNNYQYDDMEFIKKGRL